ncbi:hypothetical protein THAOC_16354 [Thalassiosira oceanica]|uniref:Uncharacterized protein n=1 Tax=Thalassiosira oceanica TaxID=159749 RepID=K0SA23_THAOC|nr:hypothetical protein THAOC_16354 [Thalassiosira oceanica]|eukprot:EJK63013.1 hypothetical protein THAOC_16354 [Thalassiosira oceanica]
MMNAYRTTSDLAPRKTVGNCFRPRIEVDSRNSLDNISAHRGMNSTGGAGIFRPEQLAVGFHHLQSLQRTSANSSAPTNVCTTSDSKLSASLDLYVLASRLDDVSTEIEKCIDVLKDRDASQNQRNIAASTMRKYCIPLIAKAVKSLNMSASELAPEGMMVKEAHRKRESAEKRRVKTLNLRDESPELYMISRYVEKDTRDRHAQPPRKKKPRIAKVSPNKVTCSGKESDSDFEGIELPRPVNQETMQYTKPEAVNWLTEHTAKKTSRRARAIDLMIKLGYAPTSVRTLQRLLKSKEQGDLVLDDDWGDSAGGKEKENDRV